jgi:hypothetical protein
MLPSEVFALSELPQCSTERKPGSASINCGRPRENPKAKKSASGMKPNDSSKKSKSNTKRRRRIIFDLSGLSRPRLSLRKPPIRRGQRNSAATQKVRADQPAIWLHESVTTRNSPRPAQICSHDRLTWLQNRFMSRWQCSAFTRASLAFAGGKPYRGGCRQLAPSEPARNTRGVEFDSSRRAVSSCSRPN